MSKIDFGVPCFALAQRECNDPMDAAQSVAIAEFGNMGRCVLLFRDARTAEDAGKALGHDIVVEVGNCEFLTLILDAAIGRGCVRVAVDYVRTLDGQACHFHELNDMMTACRSAEG